MTYHMRLNPHSLPTGPERTAKIRELLESERTVHRSASRGSYDESIAARNIADLEVALQQSEQNDRARDELHRRLEAERTDKAHERRAADDAALTAELRVQFFGVNPSATEEDFERLLPNLRDEHMVERSRTALATTRARIGRIL